MKKLLPCLIAILTLGLFSCGKSNDAAPASDSNWTIGEYTYPRATSAQTSSPSGNGGTITAIATTTAGTGGNYGVFSGGSVSMAFYSNLGEGTYTLGTMEMMVANQNTRILNLSCTVGTAVNSGAVMYNCVNNGGTAEITKDKDGKFHVNIKTAITLQKGVEVNGGIPAAKAFYAFTMNNGY
ncbi:hypothetical protein [Chitinophaga sp. Cy-1792]|uniref:hypothetical protein n=1 Tax=Chitinophaga sp. Cy-1792 TaxID=2608339 RepID=UPI0014230F92|nr:hypothetical protein [Chitinophaga sp. Cy-1792]NIG54796.1 hypothetical protein [Chitinophaga sp. Cy-1792]